MKAALAGIRACRGRKSTLPFLAVATAIALGGVGAGQQPGEQHPVAAAAKKRQEAVKTFDIRFRTTEVVSAGSVNADAPPQFKPKKLVPERETRLESVNRLVSDGNKYRFENRHPSWHVDGKLLEDHTICVFDGSRGAALYPTGLGDPSLAPSGIITVHGGAEAFRSFDLAPILLTFRAGDRTFSPLRPENLKPTGVKLLIGGDACLEYQYRLTETASWRCWVDPARDQLIRRNQHVVRGQIVDQTDIVYRQDETWGWVPASWKRNRYSRDGKTLLAAKTFEATELRINAEQAADQFQVQFPAGARVHDQRDGKNYRVQSDGTMVQLARDGSEKPGTVSQPWDSWYQRNSWWLILAAVIAVVLAAAFALWKRRKNV